jgi:hypothetical protein
MTKEELILHANRILGQVDGNYEGSLTQAKEFFKSYGGPDNSFLKELNETYHSYYGSKIYRLQGILRSFIDYVNNGLLRSISLEREIQVETVSDFLAQAESLLNDNKVHPAAPAVIIGASLEEFLRNWLEEVGVDMTTIKLSIDSYSKELRSREMISKQDLKDITSWGGTRNDAAHGIWNNVEDRNRIKLMLEGVNLFMRKYSQKNVV